MSGALITLMFLFWKVSCCEPFPKSLLSRVNRFGFSQTLLPKKILKFRYKLVRDIVNVLFVAGLGQESPIGLSLASQGRSLAQKKMA